MIRRKQLPAKHLAIYLITMLVIMVLLPYFCIRLFPNLLDSGDKNRYDGELPKTVNLYLTKEDRYEKIPFETYIQGVVASEMPSTFEEDALKAQAVASRTYALGRINAGSQLCDSVHCQVYRDHDIDDKVKDAVKETRGQVLLYRGKLAAHTLYFSSSAGKTENSQDVFSGTYAYLVSVDSSYEPEATHKEEKVSLSIEDFSEKIKDAMPECEFGKIKTSNIRILSRSEGGRVDQIQVGDETLEGTDIRYALDLYSTRFTLSVKDDTLTFTTSGSGHGVGMSQYGANGLAKKGSSYDEILRHYYKGTTVSNKD